MRYRHVVTAPGVVLRDEARFGQSLPDDEFRLHAVGTYLCHRKVVDLAAQRSAVALHTHGDFSCENAFLQPFHARFEPCQFLVVAVPRHIEHVIARHEAERIDRVRPFLRREGQ